VSDGEQLISLIPLVVGAGITLAAINYLLPEGKKSIHETFSGESPRFKSALESAGV
jgi:hypothetical protein